MVYPGASRRLAGQTRRRLGWVGLGLALGAGCSGPVAEVGADEPVPVRAAPPPVPIHDGDVERALEALAQAASVGWIACELGTAPPRALWAEGLDRIEVEGSVLRALVPTPEGAAAVAPLPGDGAEVPDPAAVLRWTGAGPGQRGSCEVVEARFALVRAVFTDPAGEVIDRRRLEVIGACWGLDEPFWDGGGGLRLRAVRGVGCRPWVRVRSELAEGGWEEHQPVLLVHRNGTERVVLGPDTVGEPVAPAVQVTAAHAAAARAQAGLPDGARVLLDQWTEQLGPAAVRDELAELLAPRP